MPDGTKSSSNNNGNNNGSNRPRGQARKSRDVIITCNKPISAGWLIFLTTLLTLVVHWLLFPMVGIEETYYVKSWVVIALIVFLLNQLLVSGCKAATWYDANPRSSWAWWPTTVPGYILLVLLLVAGLSAAGYVARNYSLADLLPKQETSDAQDLINQVANQLSSILGLGDSSEDTGSSITQNPEESTPVDRNGAGVCWSMALIRGKWNNTFLLEEGKPVHRVSVNEACWQTCPHPIPSSCDPRVACKTGRNPQTGVIQDKCPDFFPGI